MKQIIFFLLAIVTLSSCSSYGKKVKSSNIEVYYKEGITEEKAQQTADYIYSLDTNPETKDNKKSFQLSADGDTINCKMVVNEDKFEDVPMESFQQIGFLISSKVFNGKPVNLLLCTNRFKTIKTVYYTKMDDAGGETGYGERVSSGNIEVFVSKGASMTDGELLAKFLDEEMRPSSMISFQIKLDEKLMSTVRMVSSKEKIATLTDEAVNDLIKKIAQTIFGNNDIVFEFTDSNFNTLKTYNYNPEVEIKY